MVSFLKHFRASLVEIGVKNDKTERVMKLLEGERSAVLNRCDSGLNLDPIGENFESR